MLGLPRNPLVLVLVTVLAVLAALDHFLVRPVAVPPGYVGSWISGPTRRAIRPDGGIEYRTGDGFVSHVVGGRLTRIGPDVLVFRVLFVPRRLRLDAPPHPRNDLLVMTVEGQELWRIP